MDRPPAASGRLTKAELEELEAIQGKLKNAGKTAGQKKRLLETLNDQVEKNTIVASDSAQAVANSRPKKTTISDIVRPKPGESAQASTGQDHFQVLPIKLPTTNDPDEALDPGAGAVLQSIYSGGVMVLQGVGSTMEDFLRQWDRKTQEYKDKVKRGEIVPEGATPTEENHDQKTVAEQQATAATGKKRKTGAKNSGQGGKRNGNASNIPSSFSARYPIGSLPLYAPAQPTDDADPNKSLQAQQAKCPRSGHVLDHGSRYLELKIPSYRSPEFIFKNYLITFVKSTDDRLMNQMLGDASALQPNEPVLLRWEDVQSWAYVEGRGENACMLGLGCFGRQFIHPNGSFTFQKWRNPDRRPYKRSPKESNLCYADILLYLNTMKDYDRSTGRSSAGIESPFSYLIGVPGEYNLKAFRQCVDGNNEGCTRHIRHLVMTQLRPTTVVTENGERLRKFEEKKYLQCRDGSKKIAAMQPVNPRTYEDFEIGPMSNERILMMFVFRDMAYRYQSSTSEPFPECLKVCRLAFAKFEDGLKMFSSSEFRQQYLPVDFMKNNEYILKHFDLFKMAKEANPSLSRYPIFEGYMIYWLLHIRVNAALYLLQNGLDDFKNALIRGGQQQQQQQQQQAPTTPIGQESVKFVLPSSAAVQTNSVYERRAWVASSNFEEAIVNELAGIRAKLQQFVRDQNKLAQHIKRCMEKNEPFHDDALLPSPEALLKASGEGGSTSHAAPSAPLSESEQKTLDLWLSIKPSSNYIGPFFPEDRGYIEYIEKPHVKTEPGPGQLACYYIARWCHSLEQQTVNGAENASSNSAIIPFMTTRDGRALTWVTYKPHEVTRGPDSIQESPEDQFFVFPTRSEGTSASSKKQTVHKISLKMLFGDFRGLVHWMQHEASPEFLAKLYINCGRFERNGWSYTYHRKVVDAMMNGTWFKGTDRTPGTTYIILVTMQMVIYCATLLMQSFQRLYENRVAKFGHHLFQVDKGYHDIVASIVQDRPVDVSSYAKVPDSASVFNRERLMNLHESMKFLRETIYQIHKFINSHLPLASAMVKNCSNENGSGPTDRALTSTQTPKMNAIAGQATISLYELYYPYGSNVICEDNLPDVSTLESYVKFISDTTSVNKDPLLEGQQKVMPVRCHTRDHEKKIERIVFFNPAYSRYCAQNFVCSSLGAYRHCNYRTSFNKSLEIYAMYHDLSKVDIDHITAMFKRHKHVSINVLRENTTFNIHNNPGFRNAVQLSFDRYTDFEQGWLHKCMDSFRQMLDRGTDIATIDGKLREVFGKNTPYVYRRIKTDFTKYVLHPL